MKTAYDERGIPYPPLHPPIVYAALAKQILDDYCVSEGVCLDIGSGVGLLGIELARRTRLDVVLVDIRKDVLVGGLRNAEYFKVRDKVFAVQADVHRLPFRPNAANLIVSRGSIPFWRDRVEAFKEIYRVLSDSGVAFLGGGLSRNIPEKVRVELRERIRRWFSSPDGRKYDPPEGWKAEEWLRKAGIRKFRVILEDPGKWIEFRKR
ncbi:class I SAM-dependent methyltransferase [Candidatus Bathyarchaeota archaeon]|nr:class I SAM-dependent methyltransferase [Candidatus Bathyarchaeota archaeon]RJS74342.1 MAG: class I SAM-dependent methyltransferase [Candidatus Bathyarchaeota archaeon]